MMVQPCRRTHPRRTAPLAACMFRAGLLVLALAAACGGERGDASVYSEGMTAGDCSDGADNDGDGAFDCSDTGCMGAPICQMVATGDAGTGTDAGPSPGPDSGASAGTCNSDLGASVGGGPQVMLAGAWEIPDDPAFQSGCDSLLGEGDIVCMIDQSGCALELGCRVVDSSTAFSVMDDVVRSGSNYLLMGSTIQSGVAFDYTVEFSCSSVYERPPACERPDRAMITITSAIGTCIMEGTRL